MTLLLRLVTTIETIILLKSAQEKPSVKGSLVIAYTNYLNSGSAQNDRLKAEGLNPIYVELPNRGALLIWEQDSYQ